MYIPLFNKSNYTLLSSLLKIDDLIEYAINNKLPSIALTDTNMYGTMEFIKKCEKNNICGPLCVCCKHGTNICNGSVFRP